LGPAQALHGPVRHHRSSKTQGTCFYTASANSRRSALRSKAVVD
jgi:hypothetical protein